ncbi:hypothetical protein ACFFJY_09375 [Fictibacillus aquaticus]|uniref:Uncharacterized protein n=1 Tax=Fictibacillus aquaticus TaxID=2021314 RepID=A0A235FBT2_9BACL|nr:hypothetical protein [Fictibacillus aquaticus]OYD58484.1 hypothetical protein CGZ90_00865 [Fictibacillus aquaticus]
MERPSVDHLQGIINKLRHKIGVLVVENAALLQSVDELDIEVQKKDAIIVDLESKIKEQKAVVSK